MNKECIEGINYLLLACHMTVRMATSIVVTD